MNGFGYILAAWLTVLGGSALYALSLLRRGRRLSAQLPPERRRWLQSGGSSEASR